MDELREAVSRIDENVRLLREDVAPLVQQVQKNSLEISIIQNDEKWKKNIFTALIGLIGVIAGALAEFIRK